jgi:2-keto-4-pentenoate hydratase/2-oxohepta-3-ene-1,7-dioic acid hydratase in catechol pathway
MCAFVADTCARIVAWHSFLLADSRFVTMEPGDLIFTGTPSGVGCFRKPQIWLKAGDVVECEIEGIGVISNPIV